MAQVEETVEAVRREREEDWARPLPPPNSCALMHSGLEIKPMRVLAMLALALSLAGCNGDRIKQGSESEAPQAQPQTTGLLT